MNIEVGDRDGDPPLDGLVVASGAAVTRYLRRVLSGYDLTPTALGVLEVLEHTDRPSHRELAGRLGVSPGALTPVIDLLESSQAVERERDHDDRRIVRVSITSGGRARLATAVEGVARATRATFPRPTPERERIVRDYLNELLAAARG